MKQHHPRMYLEKPDAPHVGVFVNYYYKNGRLKEKVNFFNSRPITKSMHFTIKFMQ